MKLIVFLAFSCLALQSSNGAPSTAVYKFVRCNPEGDQANCVTQQSPEMAWSPDLPAKLPASTAQYLEAEPVEDESPAMMEEEESPYDVQEGSGFYEGSAGAPMGDQAFEAEPGSGDMSPGVDSMWQLFTIRPVVGEAKPAEQELREDHLLKL